jgi:hypothetical protein
MEWNYLKDQKSVRSIRRKLQKSGFRHVPTAMVEPIDAGELE